MDYWWDILNLVLIFSIFTISLNLLVGYTGQVSVAHAAFGAVGGYLAAYLSTTADCGFWTVLFVGAVGAGAVGVVMSVPALRLAPEYLVLLTIAVSSIVLTIAGAVPMLGGAYGMIADKAANLWPLPGGDLLYPHQWVLPLIGFTAITYLVCHRMGESAWGRTLRGIRDDEVATRALGCNVFAYKVIVFGLTSAFAGFGGVLLYFYNQIASPSVYGLNVSLKIFAMTIFGGLGNFIGSILGAAVLQLLQPMLEKVVRLDPGHAFLIQLVIYGLGLVVLMRVRPEGLLPEGASLWRWEQPPRAQPPSVVETSAPAISPMTTRPSSAVRGADAILKVRGLSKSFGGIHAVRGLDFDLSRGKIAALIGPNGAGKTTVFNLLTGALKPDAGTIELHGEDVRGLPPNRIARKGMVRSFQDVRLFGRMTALENVMLGIHEAAPEFWRWPSGTKGGENLIDLFLRPAEAARVEERTRTRAFELLHLVGLANFAEIPTGVLSYGQQKLVSFVRLLGTGADVLLLDEPASGIDSRWVDGILDVVAVMRDAGKTICIVEHSLHVVERLADTAIFMELGRITAQGTITELTSDPRLSEVYFGTV
ncbi:MAG TPA: branched-chain amino acid ABC transporter ATP-binding protein/permease [Bradyrhizobium sp.]|nr:branched-chain amino acid ABC transporter ATP-binding protein/permease [Bradyrhizobium sp.]